MYYVVEKTRVTSFSKHMIGTLPKTNQTMVMAHFGSDTFGKWVVRKKDRSSIEVKRAGKYTIEKDDPLLTRVDVGHPPHYLSYDQMNKKE